MSHSLKGYGSIPDICIGRSINRHGVVSMTQFKYTPHRSTSSLWKIHIGHHKQLTEHLKADSLPMSQADDGPVELE